MLPGCKGGGDGVSLRLSPCKGCPDRTTGDRATDCHTTCERYQAYKAAKIAEGRARADYNRAIATTIEGHRRLKDNPPPGPKRQR